jgi:NADPH:quinone reductase-like Zn-dependent oxidoreductase
MTIMKAAQITQYGDASVVSVREDAPRPLAGGGKVLVEVHAASINPADSSIRLGYMHQMMPLSFPATLGIDIAGVVVEADPAAGGFKAGDKVFGTASMMAGASGAFAEYAAVPAGALAHSPPGLSFEEAAALPLAGVSALQALETLKTGKGSTILITGGSGGIGTFAVQIARSLGARVIATSRGSSVDYVKSLGADQVIDLDKGALPAGLRDVDAVLDTAGGDIYKGSFAALKKGGTIVSIAARPDAELAAQFGVTALPQMTEVATARLERLAGLVAAGHVKIHVDRVFPLGRVKDAFLAREAGHVKGKIVLKIKE